MELQGQLKEIKAFLSSGGGPGAGEAVSCWQEVQRVWCGFCAGRRPQHSGAAGVGLDAPPSISPCIW